MSSFSSLNELYVGTKKIVLLFILFVLIQKNTHYNAFRVAIPKYYNDSNLQRVVARITV